MCLKYIPQRSLNFCIYLKFMLLCKFFYKVILYLMNGVFFIFWFQSIYCKNFGLLYVYRCVHIFNASVLTLCVYLISSFHECGCFCCWRSACDICCRVYWESSTKRKRENYAEKLCEEVLRQSTNICTHTNMIFLIFVCIFRQLMRIR